jgi:hypothetical protein
VTAHLVARIMQRRPFLLLQSDAILKELAHLENRVNTYVKQLELGLHSELHIGDGQPFEVRRLDQLQPDGPIDRERDVIYFPTMGDNRPVTSVFRAAGFTCIDNWDETFNLPATIRRGRQATGDSVCAPLAAVYGDLLRAVEDFTTRQSNGDPLVRGKRRLLYFDNQGDGPCRQGQYAEVHKLLAHGALGGSNGHGAVLPGGAALQFLISRESSNYDIGLEEWTLYRAYQGAVVQGVLQDLLFAGGARCLTHEEYAEFAADHRVLKEQVYGALESFAGPGPAARRLLAVGGDQPGIGPTLKYFAYRMHGGDLVRPLARFSRRWVRGRTLAPGHLRIHASGEGYMRVAQAEELFRALLSILGLGRFHMTVAPLWAYLDYLTEARVQQSRQRINASQARRRRVGTVEVARACDAEIRSEARKIRGARKLGFGLREFVARPLYTAAGLAMPPSSRELLDAAREILPTLRPHGELGPYVGEALVELRHGVDVFLSLAPTGCMVTSMGEVMTPRLQEVAGRGRIQSLFSADGDIDEELLELALLRALGPERFTTARDAAEGRDWRLAPAAVPGRGVRGAAGVLHDLKV